MRGCFITLEGTECSGKSTQLARLAARLQAIGKPVRLLREPGSTPIGEQIRQLLQHSPANRAMTAEAELLLICAARAQLVREVIRPALAAGEWVVCDRFYDSTVAYQGYGRQLDLDFVRRVIGFAVGETRPDLTLLLQVPLEVSEARRQARTGVWDRMEEADRAFFQRVEQGYRAIAAAEPGRVQVIDGTQPVEVVSARIWAAVERLLSSRAGA
jgi:dTMP kinase